ncbi:hypothetical protein ACHWQZ_G018289 [Mnemiopsis leidyi]
MLPQNLPLSLQSANRVIVNRYAVSKKIGNGTFGTVFLVEDNFKNKEKKVLKEICIGEMNEHETQSVDREANLLSKLNHHNIVRMFESFVHEESFYIVMEYCETGDLDRELKNWKNKGVMVPQDQTLDWFVQLIMAVQYIHSQKMLHRDLKCKNVFLTENKTVKIGDFGISRILTSTEYASTFTGTPYYMSPEVIKHDGYGSKSDIWSLGVILYEICELKRAFEGKNLMSVMMRIIQGKLPTLSAERGELGPIFNKMLKQDPHERPSSSQLLTEPIIAAHVSSLRKRLHNKKRERSVSSASSQASVESGQSNRKMTARERMRLEKQRRADEEAEQLRHIATENFAANRARTAARREREHNRPNIIQQSSPSLEIKAINPNVIKHDRDFCYSPKSRSPSSRRPITAIHPEPRKRIPLPKPAKDELDRQLEAIEKSLEYAKAESLSKAIRDSQNAGNVVEVDGSSVTQPGSDEEEIRENPRTPSPKSSNSNSTIDDFVDHLEQHDNNYPSSPLGSPRRRSPTEDPISSLRHTDPTSNTLSDSCDSIEEALLFETADEVCLLDVSNLELTSVSQIPENEEDANTFYSFEDFEEDAPQTPLEELESPLFTDSKIFKRASSLDLKTRKATRELLNRSLPLTSNTDPMANFNLSNISDLHLSDISQSSDLDRSLPHASPQLSQPGISPVVNRSDPNISNTSNKSDYTKSSTIVLRSDRIRNLRAKCEQRLGPDLFDRIYRYLEDARYGEDIVPEEIIVGTLRSWVPEFTSDCFSVDQLIYLEKQEMLASNSLDVL